MAKERGGQPKHYAALARTWVWYFEVKRRCQLTDYRLDLQFAWKDDARESRETDHRPRTFEWIRKLGREPQGKDKRWRNMRELVIAVEKDSSLKGTQALFDAEIWDLMQETEPTPEIVQDRIARLLKGNGLVRVPYGKLSPNVGLLLEKFGRASLFDRCLRLSFRGMNRLTRIALAWSLFQQTEPSHSSDIRSVIEAIADKLLDDFFADYLPDRHLDFYTDSIQSLLMTRVNLSSRKSVGYGFFETQGTWPVIPQALVDKLVLEDLSPVLWTNVPCEP